MKFEITGLTKIYKHGDKVVVFDEPTVLPRKNAYASEM